MQKIRELIHLDADTASTFLGKDVGIAVLDTGINVRHPDFSNQKRLFFRDYIQQRTTPYDDNGHGTHICGILSGNGSCSNGQYRGIAPKAKLYIYKTLDGNGNGYTHNSISALYDVLGNYKRQKIRLLNFSMGFLSGANQREIKKLVELIEELWDAGVCVVASAGNDGPRSNSITAPGISRKIITVGACRYCYPNLFETEYYSGRGPTTCCIVKPEIYVPGTDIVSTSHIAGRYMKRSGTSMATPIVCGALALALEANPTLTPNQLKLALYHSCIKPACASQNKGWGILHVKRLIRQVRKFEAT